MKQAVVLNDAAGRDQGIVFIYIDGRPEVFPVDQVTRGQVIPVQPAFRMKIKDVVNALVIKRNGIAKVRVRRPVVKGDRGWLDGGIGRLHLFLGRGETRGDCCQQRRDGEDSFFHIILKR